ncbi:hypothetical protein Tco_1171380 [Tanacetum coccineum]
MYVSFLVRPGALLANNIPAVLPWLLPIVVLRAYYMTPHGFPGSHNPPEVVRHTVAIVSEMTTCRESLPTICTVWPLCGVFLPPFYHQEESRLSGILLSGSSILLPLLLLPWLLLPRGICFLVFALWYLAYRKASKAADQAFDLLQVNSVPSGFVSISPAPDPSIHDDPSVNSVYDSYGISVAGVSGKFSSGFSTRRSARICPFTNVLGW